MSYDSAMPYSHDQWLTRVCWSGSVGNLAPRADARQTPSNSLDGGLHSGLGCSGPKLSRLRLQSDFRKHIRLRDGLHLERKRATALVSVSDRIIDTVQRAFSKYYFGESPEDIYIVFIKVPASKRINVAIHAAQDIAEDCSLEDSTIFKHELLFEWAIPKEFVQHTITVGTLLQRGLTLEQYLENGQLPCTTQLRDAMAETFFRGENAWEMGLSLGFFAQKFGAWSPHMWIAHQLLWDIAGRRMLEGSMQSYVTIWFGEDDKRFLGPSCLEDLFQGIETCLVDWWLADIDFVMALDEYDRECDLEKEFYVDRCVDFVENWEHADDTFAGFADARAALQNKLEEAEARLEDLSIRLGF